MACSTTYVKPGYSSPDFSKEDFKKSKSLLVVSRHATVNAFKVSFERAYSNSDSLSKYLAKTIQDSLGHVISGGGIVIASEEVAGRIDTVSPDKNSIAPNRGGGDPSEDFPSPANIVWLDSTAHSAPGTFPPVADAKYLVFVKNILINNSFRFTPGMMVPAPGGGMMMTGGGSQTYCYFSYDVEIWDAATATRRHTFNTKGVASVFLFAFKTALENAVASSIYHLMGYIRDNQTDFM